MKTVPFTLAACGVLLTVGLGIAFAADKAVEVKFKDVSGQEWYYPALSSMTKLGVIQGYPDGTFNAATTMNRAEIATVLDRYDAYVRGTFYTKEEIDALLGKKEWNTYTNDAYKFQLVYPSNTLSIVDRKATSDTDSAYIRFQNYIHEENMRGLAKGEYYLEIHVSDKKLGPEHGIHSCADSVKDAKEVQVSGFKAYRGYGPDGGDAGGARFALCLESNTAKYYVMATDADNEGAIANKILDSFEVK